MSELAKSSRKAMKSKAHRLTTGDPHAKVDASSWTPPEPLETTAKTGARPVRGRRYKHGGKVHGEVPKQHAGRKPRKSGGRAITADSLLNRDMVEANAQRKGIKHVGAFKKGGKAMKHDDTAEDTKLIKKLVKKTAIKHGKSGGGRAYDEDHAAMSRYARGLAQEEEDLYNNPVELAKHEAMIKQGEKEIAERKAKRELGKAHGGEIHAASCRCAKCGGGRMGKASGGPNTLDDYNKKYGKPGKEGFSFQEIAGQPSDPHGLTDLDDRDSFFAKQYLKDPLDSKRLSERLGPEDVSSPRIYAKGGRTKRADGGKVHAERVSDGEFEGTRPTGGRLAKRHGGRMKGATIIKIDVGTHKQHPAMGGMPPGADGDPFKPSLSTPLPPGLMPPGGMPPGAGGPPPPPMMPPGAGAPPMGGLPPGLMGRKTGGRVKYPIKDGAGGGLGRLQKIKAYGLKPA